VPGVDQAERRIALHQSPFKAGCDRRLALIIAVAAAALFSSAARSTGGVLVDVHWEL